MKIDWFYLNSLAEANVTNMRNSISNDNNLSLLLVESFSLWAMFSGSKFNQDISGWYFLFYFLVKYAIDRK